jgi:chaperonin cofactor prefoldin
MNTDEKPREMLEREIEALQLEIEWLRNEIKFLRERLDAVVRISRLSSMANPGRTRPASPFQ